MQQQLRDHWALTGSRQVPMKGFRAVQGPGQATRSVALMHLAGRGPPSRLAELKASAAESTSGTCLLRR